MSYWRSLSNLVSDFPSHHFIQKKKTLAVNLGLRDIQISHVSSSFGMCVYIKKNQLLVKILRISWIKYLWKKKKKTIEQKIKIIFFKNDFGSKTYDIYLGGCWTFFFVVSFGWFWFFSHFWFSFGFGPIARFCKGNTILLMG